MMHIRTTTFTYDPTQEETLYRLADEVLIPTYRKIPGFVSYTVGFDRVAQRGVSVTIWEQREQATAARATLGGIIQQFETAGVHFDPAQVYEVVRQI